MFELNPNLEVKKEILLESKIFIVDNFYKTLIDIFYCLGIEPVDKM